jgi:hypothetical protein
VKRTTVIVFVDVGGFGKDKGERIRDKGGINEKARERRNGERIRAKGHWKGERQRDKG